MEMVMPIIVVIVLVFITCTICGYCCKRNKQGVVYGVRSEQSYGPGQIPGQGCQQTAPYPTSVPYPPESAPPGFHHMPMPMTGVYVAIAVLIFLMIASMCIKIKKAQRQRAFERSVIVSEPQTTQIFSTSVNHIQTSTVVPGIGPYPQMPMPMPMPGGGAYNAQVPPYPMHNHPAANQLPPSYAEAVTQPPTNEVYAKQSPYNPNYN